MLQLKNPHMVLLFGPNGVGKSTLIKQILNMRNDHEAGLVIVHDGKPARVYSYSNAKDNFKVREPRNYMESFDPVFMNAKYDAQSISEGQSIIYSVFDLLDALKPGDGAFQTPGKDTIVFLDEIDSGLSIDNIDVAMRKIKYALSRRDDLQIFMSFNSPRVLKHFPQVVSMYDGSVMTLRSDEDMLNVIKAHKKEFDKARKTSRGRPKIFN